MPWPVRRNSRIWLEWAIPRDLSTYSTRLCSPLPSMVLTRSQVSTREAICWSAWVGSASEFRLVNRAVTPLAFRKSTCRVSIADTSAPVPMRRRSETGSMTTTGGIELADELLHGEEVRLEAEQAGAEAPELQQAGVDPLPQVDADRGHVPDDLGLGLLEGEVHRPFAATAGGIAELRRQRRLAGAGRAADEDRAALVEAPVAEHRVEAGARPWTPAPWTRRAAGRAR